jgi:hypothetical protein
MIKIEAARQISKIILICYSLAISTYVAKDQQEPQSSQKTIKINEGSCLDGGTRYLH